MIRVREYKYTFMHSFYITQSNKKGKAPEITSPPWISEDTTGDPAISNRSMKTGVPNKIFDTGTSP
jgi:hypothetical protein